MFTCREDDDCPGGTNTFVNHTEFNTEQNTLVEWGHNQPGAYNCKIEISANYTKERLNGKLQVYISGVNNADVIVYEMPNDKLIGADD